METTVITDTGSGKVTPQRKGKVRDIYDLGNALLIVATDRISAFDVVLPDGIPNKGRVLTQISSFWFTQLSEVVPNHILSTDVKEFPAPFRSMPEVFAGRSMLVKKTRPLPVECVVRGYVSGSGWKDYQKTGAICGIDLPPGLRESERLPAPLFTPSTKAEQGLHDENISFEEVVKLIGSERAEKLRTVSLSLYQQGAAFAETRGIIIADTKFEFGEDEEGRLVWIDEALTPDSSRFWPKNMYKPGGQQPSFDKQFVRDYLLSLDWNKTAPGPRLPREIIETTSSKYIEAYRLIAGKDLP
ncbi:MAG: phosphoribosylaminoimidazolesuccinocarboxamide synthase [Ignavibacteria bacterium]|nr:phosphoribosylaminoimidazolesuccinocarboxamide synthase [Ignavibacteria bacterium]